MSLQDADVEDISLPSCCFGGAQFAWKAREHAHAGGRGLSAGTLRVVVEQRGDGAVLEGGGLVGNDWSGIMRRERGERRRGGEIARKRTADGGAEGREGLFGEGFGGDTESRAGGEDGCHDAWVRRG